MLRLDAGGEFVMRASNIEYFAPARFDDLLEVFIRVSRIGRTSATYEMAAYRVEDDVLMVTAAQTLVLVDLDERKACPIPDVVRDRIRPSKATTPSLRPEGRGQSVSYRGGPVVSSTTTGRRGSCPLPSLVVGRRLEIVYPSFELPRPIEG